MTLLHVFCQLVLTITSLVVASLDGALVNSLVWVMRLYVAVEVGNAAKLFPAVRTGFGLNICGLYILFIIYSVVVACRPPFNRCSGVDHGGLDRVKCCLVLTAAIGIDLMS